MTVPVLAAVTGASWEAALVAGLERTPDRHHGRTPVRRPRRPARGGRDRHGPGRAALGRAAPAGPGRPGPAGGRPGSRSSAWSRPATRRPRPGCGSSVSCTCCRPTHRPPTSRRRCPRRSASRRPAPTRLAPGAAGASRWRRCRRVDAPADPGPPVEPGSGRLVAVWGPTGAPGRTTVAVDVAAELAASRGADPAGRRRRLRRRGRAGAGLPGRGARARRRRPAGEQRASSTWPRSPAVAPQAAPNLRVLTGISRADRWPELRPAALEQVWLLRRSLAAVTVVDLGFCLEQDEELSFDTAAPRRNGATLATLDAADTVLAVGAADPVGMQRLVRGLAELREVVPGRPAAGGAQPGAARRGRRGARGPARRGAGALRRGARPGVRAGGPRVPRRGAAAGPRSAEVDAGSPARVALAGIAAGLVGRPAPGRRRGLLRR